MKHWLPCTLAALLTAGALAAQATGMRVFRAGAATSNITPPLGLPIVGGWDDPLSTSVHDELHARALVLDDGATRVAIVVCDILCVPRGVFDEAKRMIREKTGIPVENMLMAATHTHSASSARGRGRSIVTGALDEYQQFLAGRIRDAVAVAVKRLEPARLGAGVGSNGRQVFNRRWKMQPGNAALRNPFGGMDLVRMNPPRGDAALIEPAGPTDPMIHFLSVQSVSGRPIALLANYSLHYVGGVAKGDISADYYGVFSGRIGRLLEAEHCDPPFVGMLSNGTSGDINNINFRPTPAEAARKYRPYEKMRLVANEIAAEVYRAYQSVEHREQVTLAMAQKELTLDVRVPGSAEIAWAEQTLKSPPKYHPHEVTYAKRFLSMKDFPRRVPVILQALRVGDAAIAAIPAEVFAEIGLELRRRSPLALTFTMELANGWYGYLPTPAQHKLGGYETWRGSNVLEIDASTKIVDALAGMLQQVAAR